MILVYFVYLYIKTKLFHYFLHYIWVILLTFEWFWCTLLIFTSKQRYLDTFYVIHEYFCWYLNDFSVILFIYTSKQRFFTTFYVYLSNFLSLNWCLCDFVHLYIKTTLFHYFLRYIWAILYLFINVWVILVYFWRNFYVMSE